MKVIAQNSNMGYVFHFLHGQIAQVVEQRTENPCVAGSTPVLANFFPKCSSSRDFHNLIFR